MEITRTITDQENRKYEVIAYEFGDPDCYNFGIKFYHDNVLIGESKCFVEVGKGYMLLGDLIIYEGYQINKNIVYRIKSFFFNYPKSYRRLGLGTKLLKMVIDKAKESGVKFLHGRITQEDFNDNPNLLNWYKKHRFCIESPFPEDENSIARIRLCLE